MHRQRETDSKSAVEDANAKFYSAFRNRDLKVHLYLLHIPLSVLKAAEAPAKRCRVIVDGVTNNGCAALHCALQNAFFKHGSACLTWCKASVTGISLLAGLYIAKVMFSFDVSSYA